MIPKKNVDYLQAAVDADVQEAYRCLLSGFFAGSNNIDDFTRLEKCTGIRPKFSKEATRKIYRECIRDGKPLSAFMLKGALHIEEPEYTEEDVQEGYDSILKGGYMIDVTLMEDITGISPNFTESAVQKEYKRLMSYSDNVAGNIVRAKQVRDMSGIEPDMKLFKKHPEAANEWFR